MTKTEQAISAVRGELRHMGLDPVKCSAEYAECVLDDMGRKGIAAGLWFWSASDNQVKKFRKGWEKWREQNR